MNGLNIMRGIAANCLTWGVFHYSNEYAWIVAGFGLGLLVNFGVKNATS